MRKLLILCLFTTSCNLIGSNEKCDPGLNKVSETASISFELLDARTSQNLLSITTRRYSPDTVKVYDANRRPLFNGPVRGDGRISFGPLEFEGNQLPYATDLTRDYYLYLNRADQDTLSLAFRLRKNNCENAEFERYTLTYNGKEVAAGEGLFLPSIILYKP